MKKSQPIELELSVSDMQYLQDTINSIFLETLKYKLENSHVSYKEKISYIDGIIKNLKSG